MQLCLIFSTLTAALMATLTETLQVNIRTKRAHVDNFNVLLKLYKMNPLKQSKTFKKFTDSVLLPNRADEPSMALNFDSNESALIRQERTNAILKGIEKKIHETKAVPIKAYHEPDYNIDDVDPEKFTVNILLNDSLVEKQTKFEKSEDDNSFKFLFGHLGSNEVDKLPVTKMLPINEKTKGNVLSKLYKVPLESLIDNNINAFKEDLQKDQIQNIDLINDDIVDSEMIIL